MDCLSHLWSGKASPDGFGPKGGERVAILIDLEDPSAMKGHAYLEDESLSIQRKAYEVFYQGLKYGVAEDRDWRGRDVCLPARVEAIWTFLMSMDADGNEGVFSESFIRNTTSFYVFPPILPPPH